MTALRTSIAALLLLLLWRPWRHRFSLLAWRSILAYGVALGSMNLLFYMALERIPLGLAVTIEFIGPLALSILSSRRRLDLIWALLAALGILFIFPPNQNSSVDLVGVLFALGAACSWALYIVWGKGLGTHGHSGYVTAWGMLCAALFAAPFGFPTLIEKEVSKDILLLATSVALFSSAIPYSLEMLALKRLSTKTFGILMSFEPMIAMLIGRVVLGDQLSPLQVLAIVCVVGASVGSVLTSPQPPS